VVPIETVAAPPPPLTVETRPKVEPAPKVESPPKVEPQPLAESAPVAESTPVAESAPGHGEELDAVLASWASIVEHVSRNPANKPLITVCRPVEVRGATIVLGFPETQAFLRDRAEAKRSALEADIGHVLGRHIAIKCVTSNIELVAATPPEPDLVAQARRIFADDLVDVAEVE
jgi:hypothetical protein